MDSNGEQKKMPAGFVDKKQPPRKVRFLTGVFYEGTDYGPGYKEEEAVIDAANAAAFVAQGRAVYVDEEAEAPSKGSKGGK